jgi:DNA ligase (NAD+)
MDGIGEKLIEALLENGLVASITDLYKLTHSQITSLDRMGDKSAYNVLDELVKTRNLNLAKFLHALGMERIGPEVATTISQHFITLDKLLHWVDEGANEELTTIDGIGDKVAATFRDGILKRRKLIDELSTIIKITEEAQASSGMFDGNTFCITGSLKRPRKEIALAIKNAGGKVVGSVSGSLDFLIAGEKAGSKLAKAQSLAVEIWTEQQLYGRLAVPKKSPKTLFDYDV